MDIYRDYNDDGGIGSFIVGSKTQQEGLAGVAKELERLREESGEDVKLESIKHFTKEDLIGALEDWLKEVGNYTDDEAMETNT